MIQRWHIGLLATAFICALIGVRTLSVVAEPELMPISSPTEQLGAGWNQVNPGGESICGRGEPYSFHVREGASNNLLIYFQGGGMCWNDQTCNASTTTFDDSINPADPSDNPMVYSAGVMHTENGENPFRDYDIAFINYCTGDMHTGNTVNQYNFEGHQFTVNHKGAVNAAAALDWLYNYFPATESVFVSGCSAGAVGAAYWATNIFAHYPSARHALLGDSGSGWRGGIGNSFALWNTQYLGIAPQNLSIETFYQTTAATFPASQVAQVNTAYDETQAFFNHVGFTSQSYNNALTATLRASNRYANFRSYTGWGNIHCLTPRTEMYTVQTNGVRFLDWMTSLASGQPVSNVQCRDCVNPEYYPPLAPEGYMTPTPAS